MPGVFLDTSILVYAFTDDRRAVRAEQLLAKGGTVSVQVLNEFANVARRKLGLSWHDVGEALEAVRSLCRPVLAIDLDSHPDALRLAERYGVSVFDAQVLASALRGGCTTFYTEDMQDGLLVDGRLRLVNPF